MAKKRLEVRVPATASVYAYLLPRPLFADLLQLLSAYLLRPLYVYLLRDAQY